MAEFPDIPTRAEHLHQTTGPAIGARALQTEVQPPVIMLDEHYPQALDPDTPPRIVVDTAPTKTTEESERHTDTYERIVPSVLDTLPAGLYGYIEPELERRDFFGIEIQPAHTETFHVFDMEDGGKQVEATVLPRGLAGFSTPGVENIYESLAFITDQSGEARYAPFTVIPTPETLKAKAKDLGIQIELMPGEGELPTATYLDVIARGKYPVATGKAIYYAHDITDDHLPAIVLGGESLRDTLSKVAARGLEVGGTYADTVTDAIDSLTGNLTQELNGGDDAAEATGDIEKTFAGWGLSADEVQKIRAEIEANARKFKVGPFAEAPAAMPEIQQSEQTSFERLLESTEGETIPGESLLKESHASIFGSIRGGIMSNVMRALGHQTDSEGQKVTGFAMPDVVAKKAREFGVDIALIPGAAELKSREYLALIADKKWPVATGDEYYYLHDISDDHLTAVVLGGDELMGELASAAKTALAGDEKEQKLATEAIDGFTSCLRDILADWEGVGASVDVLLSVGRRLGIPEDRVHAILASARTRFVPLEIDPVIAEQRRKEHKEDLARIAAQMQAREPDNTIPL